MIVASLCINQDISDLLSMQSTLNGLLNTCKVENECFSNDISETLECMISDAVAHVAKPVFRMTREDKTEAIRYLDAHGAFLVKRSTERVCAALDISRNSFYSYLDDSRKSADQ